MSVPTVSAARAAAILARGGLVAVPTETVYGLAADATNPEAVGRIFAAKGRPADHPLIVHVPDVAALGRWARDVPDIALRLAERFWPGPLTLVLRRAPGVLDAVTGGLDTVALRVPAHPLALEVLRRFGGGVAAPSANRFGRVSPTTAAHAADELAGRIDGVVDGGPCDVGIESTIVDLTGAAPLILRPGGVSAEALARVVGRPVASVAAGAVPAPGTRSPGLLARHYQPRARVVGVPAGGVAEAVAEARRGGGRVAVVAPVGAVPAASDLWIAGVGSSVEELARGLYAAFREADARGCTVIVVARPDRSGLGQAVRDRIDRASADG